MKNLKNPRKKRIFDSFSQAAEALQIDDRILRAAKRAGCTAFRDGRIDGPAVRLWIKRNPERVERAMHSVRLADQKLAEQVRRLRIENNRAMEQLVPKAPCVAAFTRIAEEASKILTQRLEVEWPNAVASMDVPSARIYGKRMVDTLLADFRGLAKYLEDTDENRSVR